MTVVLLVLAVALVFAIAAVVIGREARRLGRTPPRTVYDLDEAVDDVADRLPFEVAAELSHADVRRLLRWHLDWFRAQGITPPPDDPDDPAVAEAPLVVVEEADAVGVLADRATLSDAGYTPDQIQAVVDAHMAYLQRIGAVAPAEEPPPEA